MENTTAVRGQAPDCFHCGLPVPGGTAFRFEAPEGARSFCCGGCEAVSRAISGLGLDDYYRLRAQPANRPDAPDADHGAFDDPAVRDRFVAVGDDGVAEAPLLVEGLRCAACAWLVEQTIARVAGVKAVEVQYATRRARVRWDPAVAAPSAIFRAVAAIGYAAWPFEEGRVAQVEAGERRALVKRLWVAGLGMMQVMMYAVPTYLAAEGDVGADAAALMRWAGLFLTLPVLLYSAAPIFAGALRDLRARHLGMDVPVALGLAIAFGASAATTVIGTGEVYFDSVAMFVFLLLGSRYLELVARSRAGRSLQRLARLVPQNAHRLLGAAGLATDTVPVASLVPGDRVLVRPGETAPADGALESAVATLDESWMTGESRPVARARGAELLGGVVNAGSAFVLRVTRVGEETAISAIHRLMERALDARPRWAESAQRAVPVFVAGVLVAAAAAGLAWLAIDPGRALEVAVSVLIVTCPCALALAAPTVTTVAADALARSRVVLSRASAIETLAAATDVVFDKTGTLTAGRPVLLETFVFEHGAGDHALAIAAALARAGSHPLDAALREAAGGVPVLAASAHAAISGEGIEARVEGRRVRLGRARFAGALHGRPAGLAFIGADDPVAWLADEHGWIAAFRFGDQPRTGARDALADLRALGVHLHLLSGDGRAVVRKVAAELGIERFEAEATPAAKRAYVRALQSRGARVAMVGDGINDAPVLAQADVALAMGGGADVAKMRADVVLLSDNPADVATALRLARKARRIVRQNLAWALGYNLVVIPLAFAGMVTPLAAGIGMSVSSLVVVGNALRARG